MALADIGFVKAQPRPCPLCAHNVALPHETETKILRCHRLKTVQVSGQNQQPSPERQFYFQYSYLISQ